MTPAEEAADKILSDKAVAIRSGWGADAARERIEAIIQQVIDAGIKDKIEVLQAENEALLHPAVQVCDSCRVLIVGKVPVLVCPNCQAPDLPLFDVAYAKLQAVVDKLPKDAEGNPCVPGDERYHPDELDNGYMNGRGVVRFNDWEEEPNEEGVEFGCDRTTYRNINECYPTREAAAEVLTQGTAKKCNKCHGLGHNGNALTEDTGPCDCGTAREERS